MKRGVGAVRDCGSRISRFQMDPQRSPGSSPPRHSRFRRGDTPLPSPPTPSPLPHAPPRPAPVPAAHRLGPGVAREPRRLGDRRAERTVRRGRRNCSSADNFQYAPENPQASFDAKRNELSFPPMPVNGLTVSRRVAASPRGGWFRFTETLENQGQAPSAHHRPRPLRPERRRSGRRERRRRARRRRGRRQRLRRHPTPSPSSARVARPAESSSARRSPRRPTPTRSTSSTTSRSRRTSRSRSSIALAVRAAQDEATAFLRSVKDVDVLRRDRPGAAQGAAELPHRRPTRRRPGGAPRRAVRRRRAARRRRLQGDAPRAILQAPDPLRSRRAAAERVVAMVTLGQYRPTQLLVTDDGEVFGGTLKGDAVRLELSSGQVTAVPLATVRRFGYRSQAGEPDDALRSAGKPMVVLRRGPGCGGAPGGAAGAWRAATATSGWTRAPSRRSRSSRTSTRYTTCGWWTDRTSPASWRRSGST